MFQVHAHVDTHVTVKASHRKAAHIARNILGTLLQRRAHNGCRMYSWIVYGVEFVLLFWCSKNITPESDTHCDVHLGRTSATQSVVWVQVIFRTPECARGKYGVEFALLFRCGTRDAWVVCDHCYTLLKVCVCGSQAPRNNDEVET